MLDLKINGILYQSKNKIVHRCVSTSYENSFRLTTPTRFTIND